MPADLTPDDRNREVRSDHSIQAHFAQQMFKSVSQRELDDMTTELREQQIPESQVFNVARRLSERNEPDLLQDTFVREDSSMSYEECQRIASQVVGSMYDFPLDCQKFQPLFRSTHSTKAFDGMGSSAAAAISARAAGRENYAQIQRRYTNPKRFQDEH